MNSIFIGIPSYNSNVNNYIREYLTSKDVFYYEYYSHLDYFVSYSSKEALKRNFDIELLRYNFVFERYYDFSKKE